MEATVNRQTAQILKQQGLLPAEIVETLLERASSQGKWLGQLAVDEQMLSDDELARTLSRELRTPLIDLRTIRPDLNALSLLDAEICRYHSVIPVRLKGRELLLAVANPLDKSLVKALGGKQLKVTASIATVHSIAQAIEEWFSVLAEANRNQLEMPVDYVALPAALPAALHGTHIDYTESNPTVDPQLDELLSTMLDNDASDLHITVGSRPYMRVYGVLQQMPYAPVTPEQSKQLAYSILTDPQIAQFELENELDLDFELQDKSRFRVNLFRQRGVVSSIFRSVPTEVPSLDQLGMPTVIRNLTKRPRGLLLVTGPTGCGKSTTLAAMIHEINTTRSVHIVTIEDPIEYVHDNILSEINQRQIGRDTSSFSKALRHVLRQDPDVILIGEMRDPETITAAITAAETGHLVLSTLHTNSSSQTIDRIVDVFPPYQQWQIRGQLASILEGIISQTLITNKNGKGRSCAQEILVVNDAVRSLIRDGKIHQLPSVIQSGAKFGMQTMDAALKKLVLAGKINIDIAAELSPRPDDFRRLVGIGN
ncbi:MAG: PilT/PilU family type 4a pilus ATPase [Armatimonadota bacterium]